LLLVREILAAVDAAVVSLTVPCPLLPAAMVVAFNATPDTAGPVVVDEVSEPEPPHRIMETAATSVITSAANDVSRRRLILKGSSSL
jgi:hypothetical protein